MNGDSPSERVPSGRPWRRLNRPSSRSSALDRGASLAAPPQEGSYAEGSSRPSRFCGVRRRLAGHGVERFAAKLGQTARRVNDIRRLARLAAQRHRREKRAVGLDHDAIGWRVARRFPNAVRVLEREDARERQIEIERHARARQRRDLRRSSG